MFVVFSLSFSELSFLTTYTFVPIDSVVMILKLKSSQQTTNVFINSTTPLHVYTTSYMYTLKCTNNNRIIQYFFIVSFLVYNSHIKI